MSFVVHDYSSLSAKEARRKYVYLAHRIYAEQFHTNFLVRDVRPEYALKYEIHAFLEGRIKEFYGWNDPLGQLRDWLIQHILKPLQDALNTLWDNIKAFINKYVIQPLTGLWDDVRNAIGEIWDIALKIRDLFGFIANVIYNSLQDIWNKILGIPEQLYYLFMDVRKAYIELFTITWNNVMKPYIASVFGLFRPILIGIANTTGYVKQWVTLIWDGMTQGWETITSTVSGLFEVLSKQVAALPQAIAAAFQNALSVIYDLLKRLWDQVLVPFGKWLGKEIMIYTYKIGNYIFAHFANAWNMLLNSGVASPETAMENAIRLIKFAIGAGVELGGIALAAELAHPLKNLGMQNLASTIYKLAGYGVLADAAMGALATAAFRKPLEYAFNERFRPTVIDWGSVMELRSRHRLPDSEFLKFMGYYGYPPSYKPYFDELANTPLSAFVLRYAAMYGFFNKEEYWDEVTRLGYSDKGLKLFYLTLTGEYMESVRRYYVDTMWKRYAQGITTKDQLKEEIKAMGFPPSMLPALVQVGVIQRDTFHVTQLMDAYKYAYERGKIDANMLKSRLLAIGLDPEIVNDIVMEEVNKGYREQYMTDTERIKHYSSSIVISRYANGMISDNDFVNEMKALGYSESYARRMLIGARLRRDYTFAKKAESYIKHAYIKKQIDDAKFVELMRSYGFEDWYITQELDLLKLAYGLNVKPEEVMPSWLAEKLLHLAS